ncbi:MAG TPA: response regulator [Bryobacteraceae bacterium]|nr:response regulator [Bryobacteraceae bacterium]
MSPRRILLIEDELALAQLLERYLVRLGFEIDAESTAQGALARLTSPSSRYDLVVADMGLPDMPGEALLARILELQPQLPVLICSGSEFFVESLPAELQPRVAFLQKPFLPKELVQKIEQMLAHGTGGAPAHE